MTPLPKKIVNEVAVFSIDPYSHLPEVPLISSKGEIDKWQPRVFSK